jgi:effector-binding domain-containing protein
MDDQAGTFDTEPAVFVATSIEGEGDIHVGETAGGEALVTTHIGPYATLGQSWGAILGYAAQLKRQVSGSPWEVYLDDPQAVAAESLRTELYVPLAP